MSKIDLTTLMDNHHLTFKTGIINLIEGNCGCGKTYYMMDFIKNTADEIIYVCDTIALKDNILRDFADAVGDKNAIKKWKNGHYSLNRQYRGDNGEDYSSRIDFMTYAAFGATIKNKAQYMECGWINPIIILDEAHQLFNYYEFYEEYTEVKKPLYEPVIEWLQEEDNLKDRIVIALTATPEQLRNYCDVYDVLGEYKKELKSYSYRREIPYTGNLIDLIKGINFTKAVIYMSGKVTDMIAKRNELEELGYNVECLYSNKPMNPTFTSKRQEVYNELIEYGTLSVDILIINAGYMSGINIENNKKLPQLVDVFIYDCKVEHQQDYIKIQSLGRIRHDIDRMYTRIAVRDYTKAIKDEVKLQNESERRIALLEAKLNQKLSTAQFKELAIELNFTNRKNGRLISNPKKEIESLGYKIQNKRTKKERFIVISK